MPAHLRVSLADRPGALAALARALAAAGANVMSVTVLQREAGRAVDDLLLDWPPERRWDAVVRAVEGCSGARLHGLRNVTELSPTRECDLVVQITRQPHRAAETMVDALPAMLLSDWAALIDRRAPREPLYSSAHAPVPLPASTGTIPRPRALNVDGQPLAAIPVPNTTLRLLVGRLGGPGFTTSELERCAALVDAVGGIVATAYRPAPAEAASPVSAQLVVGNELRDDAPELVAGVLL